MTTMNLTDYADDNDLSISDAIADAFAEGWTLNTYADPTSDGDQFVSVWAAGVTADDDPSLVYLTR